MTKNTNTRFVSELLKNKKSFLTIFVLAASSLMTFEVVAKDEDIEEEKIAEHRRPVSVPAQVQHVPGPKDAGGINNSGGLNSGLPGYTVDSAGFSYAGTTNTIKTGGVDVSAARTIFYSSNPTSPVGIVTASALDNTGMGFNSFSALTTGAQNASFGSLALDANTTGSNNIAVGYNALTANTTGTQNVAIGTSAGAAILTTSNSTAVGYNALLLNTGASNTAIGSGALDANVAGTPNTAVGLNALGANVSGNNNTAVGASAGLSLLTNQNTAVGSSALAAACGADCTAVGYQALTLNTGASNTAVGSGALDANVAGTPNTAVGFNALGANVSGNNNTAVGASAGLSLLTDQNTAVGSGALAAASGANCTAVGYNALLLNTGAQNTAVGSGALDANTSGTPNTAVGFNALGTNSTGASNVAVGSGTLAFSTGNQNTGCGSGAGALTTGADNTYIGFNAGSAMTTGNNNIMIGSGTTFQGADAITSSNVIVIRGSTEQTKCYIGGIRGRTTDAADAVAVLVSSTGQLGTVSSSRRYKENIVPVDQATAEKLAELNIVTFSYISDKTHKVQYGAIAEEVFEIFPELIVYNQDGEIETIQYHHFVPLLIKYAQVQNSEVNALKAVVAALIARVEALENK